MTKSQLMCALAVSFALVGCRPSAQSSRDTSAAASSTVPAVTAAPSDSVAAASTTSSTRTNAGPNTTTGTAKKKTTSTSTTHSSKAGPDSGIIGRDSVIRFPVRGLPTVSSTPSRK